MDEANKSLLLLLLLLLLFYIKFKFYETFTVINFMTRILLIET